MEPLIGFGEFALALAGFAAIALVLGQREGILSPGNAFLVQMMVVNALGPALVAMLGVALDAQGLAASVWLRICSGVYVIGAAVFVVVSMRLHGRLRASGDLALSGAANAALWAIALVAHALQVVNLVGAPVAPSLGLFLLGLWMLLLVAGIQFVALLFSTVGGR